MQSADRAEFIRLVEMLCAGFNVPPIEMRVEAYWRGLQKMDLPIFARVVEYVLGSNGPERIPTVPQVWNLQREMRRSTRAPVPTANHPAPASFGPFHCFGQRCLMRWLMQNGPASAEQLERLIEVKNLLVGQYRQVATECEVTAEEVRESLLAAFRRAA